MRSEQENLPAIVGFLFEGIQFRTMLNTETNEGYVCLSDLLKAQGSTTNTYQALSQLEEIFEDGYKIVIPIVDALGRIQDTIFISEQAATFIISRGRTEVSKRLNRWLFTEVIPSLRKTGQYTVSGGPHQKAFDPTIGKKYALGTKIVTESLKVSKRVGISLYEARIKAVHEATLGSGVDYTHWIPLIPKEEQKQGGNRQDTITVASSGSNANLADEFFQALNALPQKERQRCLDLKEEDLLLRLPEAREILRARGQRFAGSDLMRALKKHPAFRDSNMSCRALFGAETRKCFKVWIFNPSVLSASSEGKAGGQS